MPGRIQLPEEARRGTNMSKGKGWRLVNKNRTLAFKSTLITTIKAGGERLAIFRVF